MVVFPSPKNTLKDKLHKILNTVKEYSGVFAIVISLMVFFFGSIKDCTSNYEKKIAEYNENAMKYRPFIILQEQPIIKELIYEMDSSWLDSVAGLHSIRDSSDLPRTSYFEGIRLRTSLSLFNNGNYPTRILSIVITDTLTTFPLYIKWFKRSLKTTNTTSDKFYKNFYLGVKGKYEYVIEDYKINNYNDSSFVIHYIVNYENDLGVIYYSYFTVEYLINVKEVLFNYDQIKKAQKYPYLRIVVKGDATKILQNDFDIGFYSYDEANDIYSLLNKKSKELDYYFNPPSKNTLKK